MQTGARGQRRAPGRVQEKSSDPRGKRSYHELLADRQGLLEASHYETQVCAIADAMATTFLSGHKVLWMGNGGSAADAQHLAAEFSGRFLRDRRGYPSEALSTNSSAVTAIANDFGYERVFARQVEAHAQPGDMVVGITTSGNSPNIVLALAAAREAGAHTVAFTGNGGGLVAQHADLLLLGPSGTSAIIQEVHITFGHIICDLVEQRLLGLEAT